MRQAHFDKWAAGQDQQVEARVPELKGPNKERFLQAAKAVFYDAGLNDAEIMSALRTPAFRSAQAQIIVCQAARAKLAEQGLAEKRAQAKQRPAPRMLRPGNGRGYSGGADREVAELSARLTKSGKLKDAAALLSAKRRAARSH